MTQFNRHYSLSSGWNSVSDIRDDIREELGTRFPFADMVFKNDGSQYYVAYEGRISPDEMEQALKNSGYEPQTVSYHETPIETL